MDSSMDSSVGESVGSCRPSIRDCAGLRLPTTGSRAPAEKLNKPLSEAPKGLVELLDILITQNPIRNNCPLPKRPRWQPG